MAKQNKVQVPALAQIAAIVNRHSEKKITGRMLVTDAMEIVLDLLEKWEPTEAERLKAAADRAAARSEKLLKRAGEAPTERPSPEYSDA